MQGQHEPYISKTFADIDYSRKRKLKGLDPPGFGHCLTHFRCLDFRDTEIASWIRHKTVHTVSICLVWLN